MGRADVGMYAECARRARAQLDSEAGAGGGGNTLVHNPGNLELYLFLK